MRYNKHELIALASQTSQSFDREGVLLLKERQDGFFRRSEGFFSRWFRLRGNLLFYLKGPEPWYEPMGIIVLGHHEVKVQSQDENGNWPFHIVWENGVCYRMACHQEWERMQWLNAIEMAPYHAIRAELSNLREKLNRIRPVVDIATYRLQKGIVIDMNEVPLCELALSCDNLLCDAHGNPPSPLVVVYVKFHKGLCVKYGCTEIVDACSNPCFGKTVLFRACDGLTGDALVRIVVYNVKERVSETTVPMGYTALQLSTIQEAQRLRVALQSRENKTVGFVTMNGWSLEPSYIGTSPVHSNDRNSIELPQKALCHRRSQSLPPRLGLKLKFPSYGSIIKQNFVNSFQVTYRFHSGLGGDITVHEVMAEPRLCYQMPVQLLEIYIQRERELLEELLAVGEICAPWQKRQMELVNTHVSLLKHYGHSKRRLLQCDSPHFKPSCKKDDASLEFAPINLHLQRMWVHNDTLNKTGFHDVITAGAFAAHTHKAERNGGLIRLVQQLKAINGSKAVTAVPAGRLQANYDSIAATRRARDEIVDDLDRIAVMLQARQKAEVICVVDKIRNRTKHLQLLFDPESIEESLSYINFPNSDESQTMTTILNYTERLSLFDAASDIDYSSTPSSSKDNSPTLDIMPTLSSSVPNICPNSWHINHSRINEDAELQFYNDYFRYDEGKNSNSNYLYKTLRPAVLPEFPLVLGESKLRSGSLKNDFKSSTSLDKGIADNLNGNRKNDIRRDSLTLTGIGQVEADIRDNNLKYLKNVSKQIADSLDVVAKEIQGVINKQPNDTTEDIEKVRSKGDTMKANMEVALRWMRVAHAALRVRCESQQWTRDHAALQTRRDTCFSQALTTATTGILCWFSSVAPDVIVKLLSCGLGPLCSFEGLLSLYASEKAMWGDMVVAVEDLQTVQFKLAKTGHCNSAVPQLVGARDNLTVYIPISESLYSKFTCKDHVTFTVTAVFFNIGINEKATMAESLGETTPQHHSNCDNLERLNIYYHKYSKLFYEQFSSARAASSSRTKPLEEIMENLRTAVHRKIPKNVEVLHLAALATRLMNGIRFTSCKSAKDRTGMSVTLEQCSILTSEYHLAEHEYKRALDIMRGEGCRRENTLKNIGVKKYAFTKKQVMALPEEYRPPPACNKNAIP